MPITVKEGLKALGINRDETSPASLQEKKTILTKAFKEQALKWHPDLYRGNKRIYPVAEAKMKEINEAYSIVSKHLEDV